MHVNKKLRRIVAAGICAGMLTFAPYVYNAEFPVARAEVQMYVGTAEDYPSQYETQEMAKLRAKNKAIRMAQERAIVALTAYANDNNLNLTENEINAIISNAYTIDGEVQYERIINKITDENTVIVWRATVNLNIDDAEIQNWLQRDSKDKSTIISQTESIIATTAKNDADIEELRRQADVLKNNPELQRQFEHADQAFIDNQKLAETYQNYYHHDYEDVATAYEELLEANPEDYEAYNNRGEMYVSLKNFEQALADFDKAIELNPDYAPAYVNRGVIYKNIKNYDKATDDFDKAIALNPADANAYINRGEIHTDLNNYEQAMTDLNKAIELNPNHAVTYRNRGMVNAALKDYDKAITDFSKAIELNPNDIDSYYNRGMICAGLRRYEQVISDYSKVIEFNPDFPGIYNERGLAYALTGDFENAINDANKAIELNPNNSRAYQLRGLCYERLGDTEQAEINFAKANELNAKS